MHRTPPQKSGLHQMHSTTTGGQATYMSVTAGKDHDDDVKKNTGDRESSLPLAQSAALAIAYTFGCIAFFLLIRYSKVIEQNGGPKYDNAAAVFFTELFKWLFSVSMMYHRTGKFLPLSVFRDGTWKIGVYYAVPSGIYAVYNNLTYFNLASFDPGTYQVFMQTRVIFTGIVYVHLLNKTLSGRKWTALVVLAVGVASKYISWNVVNMDWHVVFMLFQASLSALAGVYNEFLLKKDIAMDVNEQNFFMYSFALVFNLLFGLYDNPSYYVNLGFLSALSQNRLMLLIVITGAAVGIVTSLILKFINVLVKAFASACEVLLTAVFAWLLLAEPLTFRDLAASTIVMGSIYLYYTAPSAPSTTTQQQQQNNAPQQVQPRTSQNPDAATSRV